MLLIFIIAVIILNIVYFCFLRNRAANSPVQHNSTKISSSESALPSVIQFIGLVGCILSIIAGAILISEDMVMFGVCAIVGGLIECILVYGLAICVKAALKYLQSK